MSRNKKLLYGDNSKYSIFDEISEPVVTPPTEGRFTFDRNDIKFSTNDRTFDEN